MSIKRQPQTKGYSRKREDRGSPVENLIVTKTRRMEDMQLDEVGAMAALSEESSDSEPEQEIEIEIPEDTPPWVKLFMNRFDHRFDRLDRHAGRMETRLVKKIDLVNKKADDNKTEISKNESTIKELRNEIDGMKNEMKNMKLEQQSTKRRIINSEKQALKDTLMFDGIPESENESLQECVEKLSEKVATHTGHQFVDNMIIKCFRIGRKPDPEVGDPARTPRPRGILVKFASMRERELVWGERFKYKDTNIYLNELFPREIENKRRELYPILRLIKKMDHYRKVSSIVGDRLMINGRGYTTDTLHTLPDDINIQPLYTKCEDGVTFFYRHRSPLSNHYLAKFTLEGVEYNCSEQYYFAQRAEDMGDDVIHGKVMAMTNPKEMLRHGRKAQNKKSINVEEAEVKIMKRGVRETFDQNPALKDFLMSTNKTKIGESSPSNKKWGTGFYIGHKDCFNTNLWAENLLGEIIEQQRDLYAS